MKNQSPARQCELPSAVNKSAATSPFVVEFFMVQSLCFRGMAYCDQDGVWRNAFAHTRLFGRIYLLE